MVKSKPILPCERERKRYLLFEIISDSKFDSKDVSRVIRKKLNDYLGLLDSSKAGIMFLSEKYKGNKGILKVNNLYLNKVQSGLLFIKSINDKKCIIKSIKSSGAINKVSDMM